MALYCTLSVEYLFLVVIQYTSPTQARVDTRPIATPPRKLQASKPFFSDGKGVGAGVVLGTAWDVGDVTGVSDVT